MSKVKINSRQNIYGWIAIGLAVIVLTFILFLVGRQVFIDKKLASFQNQSQLPISIASPTPRPDPKYTTPKDTESWIAYEHPQQNFTVRYPQDMKVGTPNENYISFYTGDNPRWPNTVFSVGKLEETLNISHSLLTLADRQRVVNDLFNTRGNFVRRYRETKTNYVQITKKASLTLSGYPAVFYTEAYISWSGQEPSSYQNRYLIKVDSTYYSVSEGYSSNLTSLKDHEQLLGLVARSLTLF